MKKICISGIVVLLLVVLCAVCSAETLPNLGQWCVGQYVDEFDFPTGDHFVGGTLSGTRTASASTNKDRIEVKFRAEYRGSGYESYWFELLMNGYYLEVNHSNEQKHYDVVVMDPAQNKYNLSATVYPGYHALVFDDPSGKIVERILQQDGTVRFSVTQKNDHSERWVFAIESTADYQRIHKAYMELDYPQPEWGKDYIGKKVVHDIKFGKGIIVKAEASRKNGDKLIGVQFDSEEELCFFSIDVIGTKYLRYE